MELKNIASDNMDRYGFLTAEPGKSNIPEIVLAKRCNMSLEEFLNGFTELRSVGFPAQNGEGLYFIQELVDQQAARGWESQRKRKQRRRKSVPPLSHDCPTIEDEDDSESVVKSLKKGGLKGGFSPPTPEEASEYAKSIGFVLNGEKFVNHYAAKGWMMGKNKIKDWKACVKTWKTNEKEWSENASKLAEKPFKAMP